jgi:N-dimethylarginine dimethylaminohydrolase
VEAGLYVTNTLRAHNMSTNFLQLVDERFYHLDTCFCPLASDFVLYFPKAFDEQSNNKIISHFNGRSIPVSEEDATNFACNAINIGDVIILNKASDKLKDRLNNAGFEVIEIDLSEFMKSGGSAKCLTLKL